MSKSPIAANHNLAARKDRGARGGIDLPVLSLNHAFNWADHLCRKVSGTPRAFNMDNTTHGPSNR